MDILGFEKCRERERGKKLDRPPPRIEPASGQNKLESGPFSALATCANKAVVGDLCIILTPWFSEAKGFFCFFVQQKVPRGWP